MTRELAAAGVSIPPRVGRARRARPLRGARPRLRMLTGERPADGDLRRQRHAGARRDRGGPRGRPPRPRRPVGHRLRRHRGGRLRRADDGAPAARSSRAGAGAEMLLAEIDEPIRPATGRPACHPSWWSARPRRLRRRAVDERPTDAVRTRVITSDTTRGGDVHGRHQICIASRAASVAAPPGVAMLLASIVAACASPGAVTSPRRRPRPATRRRHRPRHAPTPSASAATAPGLRDRPGRPERLLRDRLRHPVQAVRGVHQAVPERDLGHQAGPVHEPDDRHAAPALGRQPARPDPAAVDGLAGQGRAAQEPRRLRDRVRLGPVVGRAARPEPRRRGRHARIRLAVRDGSQLQPDRRLLQQGAGRADRHDRAADDASPSSRPCSRRPRTPVSSRSCSGTPRRAAAGSPSRSRT